MNTSKTNTEEQSTENGKSLGLSSETHRLNFSNEREMWDLLTLGNPLMIARENEMWYVLLGKQILSKDIPSMAEALEDAKRTDLTRMLQLMTVVAQFVKDDKIDIKNIEVKE